MRGSGIEECVVPPASDTADPMLVQELQRYRQNAIGVLLFLLVEDYENRFLQAYREEGFSDVLRSHGAVFRYLEVGGAPISVIARRAGITKQSVGRLVRELQGLGYLSVAPDPGDRRIRRVDFTARGRSLVDVSAGIVERIRDVYEAEIGAERFARFSDALASACDSLSIAPAWGERGDRFHHFGRLLVELAEDFERRLLRHSGEEGAAPVTRPMLTVLYRFSPSGQSISELARQLPVTVQAVSLTVRRMVADGYLTTPSCREDSRSRHLVMTPAGRELLAVLNGALTRVRGDYRRRLGARRLAVIESALAELVGPLAGS